MLVTCIVSILVNDNDKIDDGIMKMTIMNITINDDRNNYNSSLHVVFFFSNG